MIARLERAKQKAALMTNPMPTVTSVPKSVDILATLRQASAKTGSDFDYLLNTAMRESSLQPLAKSKHSSATGLFQFIDQTWLSLVKRHGGKHGLGDYAAAIQQNKAGGCSVPSAETKAAILALRQNPELSALMAGEAARETKESLECSLGREVNCGELYAAHFLGQGGAKRLLSLHDKDPGQRADLAFPQAANANRRVFYHADGRAKTVGELYSWITKEPAAKPAVAMAATATAPAQNAPQAIALDADCTLAPTTPSATRTVAVQDEAAQVIARSFSNRYSSIAALNQFQAVSALPQMRLALSPAIMELLASAGAGYDPLTQRSERPRA